MKSNILKFGILFLSFILIFTDAQLVCAITSSEKYETLNKQFDELIKRVDSSSKNKLKTDLENELNAELGLTGIRIGKSDVTFQSDIVQLKLFLNGVYLGEIITRTHPFDRKKFIFKAKRLLQFDKEGRLKLFHKMEQSLDKAIAIYGLRISKPTFMFDVDIERVSLFYNNKFLGDVYLHLYPFDTEVFISRMKELLQSQGLIVLSPAEKERRIKQSNKFRTTLERKLRKKLDISGISIGKPDIYFQSNVIQLKLKLNNNFLGDIIIRKNHYKFKDLLSKTKELLNANDEGIQRFYSNIDKILKKEFHQKDLMVHPPSFLFSTNIVKFSIYKGKNFIGDIYMQYSPFNKAEFMRKVHELLRLEGY